MNFDTITIASIHTELSQILIGGRVQQAVLPDEWSVGLEIFANQERHNLYLSAHAQLGRVHLVSHKLRRGVEVHTPLLLLLRKYVRGGRLVNIEQPDPIERILHFQFDHTEHGVTTLVLEVIGRQSNILLLDPGKIIMDAVRRSEAKTLRDGTVKLPVRPGQQYKAPLPQDKLSPCTLTEPQQRQGFQQQLQALTQENDGKQKLWRAIVQIVAGCSPTLAREIAWRAAGDEEAFARDLETDAIIEAIEEVWSPLSSGAWSPGLIMARPDPGNLADDTSADDAQTSLRAVGFTAYPAHVLGTYIPVTSMSQALEQFYSQKQTSQSEQTSGSDSYLAQRNTIASLLRKAVARTERLLAKLAEDEPTPGEADELRMQAEWLLALSSQIEANQSILEVDVGTEQKLEIKLDPKLKPVEQAQRMFKRASKLERAAEFIPKRRAKLQTDLNFLEQLSVDLTLAENQPEIVAVREELRKMGLLSSQQAKPSKMKQQNRASQPIRYRSVSGIPILVGRNARQNEIVTFKMATGDDMWLHVRDVPGSHVVIRNGGQAVDEQTLETAAQLAAYYSKKRGEKSVPVAVTSRRFVTRVPGGRAGQVYMRNEQTVTVTATLPENILVEK